MNIKHNITRKGLFALMIALSISISSSLFATPTYGAVIDGEPLEQSLITLKGVYDDYITSDDVSYDTYRSFFTDVEDTADAFFEQVIHDRDLLVNVTDVLLREKERLTADLETYSAVLDQYGKQKKMYDKVIDDIMSASTTSMEENWTLYESTQSALSHFTLKKDPNGYYYLYDNTKSNDPLCAVTNKAGYSSYVYKRKNTGSIMISFSENGIYKGPVNNSMKYDGEGTLYKNSGIINKGTWEDGHLSGTAYIYDTKTGTSNTAQFVSGERHGMTIFQDEETDDIYTRIYQHNLLEGASYTKFTNSENSIDMLTYHTGGVELPIRVTVYEDGSYNIRIYNNEDPLVIYHSDTLSRTFIGQTENNLLSGFGYGLIEDIEYIGSFSRFNILGDGTYYHVDDTESVFENTVSQIIDEKTDDDMQDAQKIKIIHDYLVSSILYHHPGAAVEDHPGYTHTAYGAIVYKRAVCDGYAQAFKAFLDRFGIENEIVFGKTINADGVFSATNNHAWNIVKIGDKYLHFDLTWNDPTYSSRIRHDYYMMDSETMRKDHKWDEEAYAVYLEE